MNWIKDTQPRPGVTVKVLFDNRKEGFGHMKTDPNRPVWMTQYDDEPGFLSNKAWSGVQVIGWKEINQIKKAEEESQDELFTEAKNLAIDQKIKTWREALDILKLKFTLIRK